MNLHLAEIATQIPPGAHAALLVDQAGWHLSGRLTVPPNITLIPLPAKCPELNPQENVWQFMRDNLCLEMRFGGAKRGQAERFADVRDQWGTRHRELGGEVVGRRIEG